MSIDFEACKKRIVIEKLDVGEMDSVRQFAMKVQENFESINILINNGEYKNLQFIFRGLAM